MKKFLLIIAFAAIACISVSAQPRAIGARLGYGVSVSYQHSLGEANMLSLDVDAPGFSGIGATCTYDWLNPFGTQIPWNNKGEWNWYLGVGGSVGCYPAREFTLGYVGVAGRVGVEYNFWFPLQLSVDWTPNVGPVFNKYGVGYNTPGLFAGAIAIGVRYKF